MIQFKRALRRVFHKIILCCGVSIVLFVGLLIFTKLLDPIEKKLKLALCDMATYAGLEFQAVDIVGVKNANIKPQEIIKVTGNKKISIFNISLNNIQKQILTNPWVDKVVVRRLLPNRISIIINEKVPFALWQCDGNFSVINQEGDIITTHVPTTCQHLPHIIGKNANINALPFLSLVDKYPYVKAVTFSTHYRNSRRWDIITKQGQIIKMPEKNLDKALKYLDQLSKTGSVQDKKVTMIDLRDDKRYYIRNKR